MLSLLRTFCVGVVRQLMHVFAQNLFGCIPQLFGTRAVDEGAAAVHVNAEDAFTGRLQQLRQPVAPDHLPLGRKVGGQGCGERRAHGG